MKKRILIGVFLGVLCLVCLGYLFGISFHKHVVHEKLASLVPATPLFYIQCSHLKSHLEKLSQSPWYQKFLQSPLWQQIKAAAWWNELTGSFQELWGSMLIDPMRIVGTDLAIGVYEAEKNDILPGIILVSRIDRIVYAAERLFYLFDRFSGQIGLRFTQEVEGFPVYVLERQDMLFPIYYSRIDEFGFISTSFLVLRKTMLQALGVTEKASSLFPFQSTVHEIPESRFVTSYVHPERLFKELYFNRFFRSLRLVDEQQLNLASDFPLITFFLNTGADKTILETKFSPKLEINRFPPEDGQGESQVPEVESSPKYVGESMDVQITKKSSGEFHLIMGLHSKHLVTFLQTLKTLFPQLEWSLLFQWVVPLQRSFGKFIECRLSKTLLGTLYTVPDVFCLSEVSNPVPAFVFLDRSVETVLDQFFSSSTQRAFVKKSNERYQDTEITYVRVLLQDILSYTVLKSSSVRSQSANVSGGKPAFYTLLTTSTDGLKKYIDLFLASSGQPFSPLLELHPSQEKGARSPSEKMAARHEVPVAAFFIQNESFSEWLKAVSQTRTFSLIFPPKHYQGFYQALPSLLIILKSLPPVFLHVTLQDTRLSLSLEIMEECCGGVME